MLKISLILLLVFSFQAQAQKVIDGPDSNFEDVKILDNSLKAYTLKDHGGFFVISTTNFSNSLDAKNFCDSVSGVSSDEQGPFDLIDAQFALSLIFLGLPFQELVQTSQILKPLIDHEGMRSGFVFWTYFDDKVDKNRLMAFTNGNGAGAGAYQDLDAFNNRLAKASLPNLALPAICVDRKLNAIMNQASDEEVLILE